MLIDIITTNIKQKQIIGFDEFMNIALYHNNFGYYRTRDAIGRHGDFITAPEISELFGFSLAKQIALIGGDVLEFGAGNGVLAAQILTYLHRHNKLPEKYYIIELSAKLQLIQQQTIFKSLPQLRNKVSWISNLPENFSGTIIANEVLDAMPTKRAIVNNGYFYELGVGLDNNNQLIWKSFSHTLSAKKYDLIDGYTTEINTQQLAWLETINKINGSFIVLIIDYGYTAQEFFHPQRIKGTLRCYKNHVADDNPFVDIGKKDISCWVNFSALAEKTKDLELEIIGYNTQTMFLVALGIEGFLNKKQQYEKITLLQQIKQLIMPEHMGESFKLLALAKNNKSTLKLFDLQNLSHKL